MNIIILGPQGSGKGTQGKLLKDHFGLFYLEAGSFLRQIASKDERIDELINKKGELLPDEEVFGLISKYLEKEKPDRENILFDGFPRSVKQYELLKQWLKKKNKKVDYAIFLDVSEAESIKRLSSRRICSRCGRVYNLITNPPKGPFGKCECGGDLTHRQDDKLEAIAKRLKLYKKKTKPLLEVLKQEKILVRVDGERPIDVIFEDILKRLRFKK